MECNFHSASETTINNSRAKTILEYRKKGIRGFSGSWEHQIYLRKKGSDEIYQSLEECVKDARDLNCCPIRERRDFQDRFVVEDELVDEVVDKVTAFARAIRDNDMDSAMLYQYQIIGMKSIVLTWQERIDKALKSGEFTAYDVTAVETWLLHPMLERQDVYDRVYDRFREYDCRRDFTPEALELTKKFTNHVKNDEVKEAEQCLHEVLTLDRVELNWQDKIDDAREQGEFTTQDINDADNIVGNILSDRADVRELPYRYHGEGLSKEASKRRDLFAKYVREHNFDKAESLRKKVLSMKTIYDPEYRD